MRTVEACVLDSHANAVDYRSAEPARRGDPSSVMTGSTSSIPAMRGAPDEARPGRSPTRERRAVRFGVLVAVAAIFTWGVCLPAKAQQWYAGASYLDSSGEFDTSLESFDPDSSG